MAEILYRISQATGILMMLGWIAVVCTAVFLVGGHPPLSAYVGVAVIVSSWFLGPVGILAGLISMRHDRSTRARVIFVILNAALLGFSIVISFM